LIVFLGSVFIGFSSFHQALLSTDRAAVSRRENRPLRDGRAGKNATRDISSLFRAGGDCVGDGHSGADDFELPIFPTRSTGAPDGLLAVAMLRLVDGVGLQDRGVAPRQRREQRVVLVEGVQLLLGGSSTLTRRLLAPCIAAISSFNFK